MINSKFEPLKATLNSIKDLPTPYIPVYEGNLDEIQHQLDIIQTALKNIKLQINYLKGES